MVRVVQFGREVASCDRRDRLDWRFISFCLVG